MTPLAALIRLLPLFLIAFAGTRGFHCISKVGKLSPSRARLDTTPLTHFDTKPTPWLTMQAFPDYYYLGSTPREMALDMPPQKKPVLPERLKELAERELNRIRIQHLHLKTAQFEIWPNYDDWSFASWVIGRWRESPDHPWKWLDESYRRPGERTGAADPTTVVYPKFLDPRDPKDRDLLFNKKPKNLYQLPSLGWMIWTTPDYNQVLAAWVDPEEVDHYAKVFDKKTDARAIMVAPPARFNGEPMTMVVTASKGRIEWPRDLKFRKDYRKEPKPVMPRKRLVQFTDDFGTLFLADAMRYSGQVPPGEKPPVDPQTGIPLNFKLMGVGQDNNHLMAAARLLKKEAMDMGYVDAERKGYDGSSRFEVRLQRFEWQGRPMANYELRIKGSLPASENYEVHATGHYDKAIAEDIYEKTGKRVTTPGMDDNATSVATLQRMAQVLINRYRDKPPLHDIVIKLYTGEEFPGNCLGARHDLVEILKSKRKVRINVNFDMTGYRKEGDPVFQINPGDTKGAVAASGVMLGAALAQGGDWEPTVRLPGKKDNFVAQTDSFQWENKGEDTILDNEWFNLMRRIFHRRYHQSTDTKIDLPYAEVQAKTGIEAVVRFAETP